MYDVIVVTGYKASELGIFQEKHDQLSYLKKAIKRKLEQIIEDSDAKWIITSGQPGVELWAAEAVLELKRDKPDLKLATLAPFTEQSEKFNEKTKELYDLVWKESDFKDYITKRPYENPRQFRLKNTFLVDKSNAAIVLYDEMTDGTPKYFLESALKKSETEDYPIYFLTPDDIEDLIREEIYNES